jgi:hypothetical protein
MITHLLKFLLLFLALTLQLSAADSLKLIHPNGGEVLKAGANTKILWEGIPDTSSVEIKFSSDNGKSWDVLFDSANGLSERWTVPNIESDSCLVVVNRNEITFSNELEIEWEKSYGGSSFDEAYSIIQTHDEGFLIAGYSLSIDGDISNNKGADDYWVIKLDSTGMLEWERSYGGSDYDMAYHLAQTKEGGYIITGTSKSTDKDVTNSKGEWDYWIIKLSSNGELEWEKTYGGSSYDSGNSISQTNDCGFIVAGNVFSKDGDISTNKGAYDYWVIKLDSTGMLEWEKSYGGNGNDWANSIIQTFDGGYIVAGSCWSTYGDKSVSRGKTDYWIVKLSSIGELEWEKTFGGEDDEIANTVIQTLDKGYIVVGYSESLGFDITNNRGEADCWIVKINESGELEWEKSLGGSSNDYARSIVQTLDKGYIIAGITSSKDLDVTGSITNQDYWIIKIDPSGNLQWQKSLGGSEKDIARSIVQTTDGDFVVAGSSFSLDNDISNNKGESDYWVVKFSRPDLRTNSDTSDAVFSIVKPDEPEPDTTYNVDYYVYNNNQSNSANAVVILDEDTDITIEVYDLLGRRIMEIYSGLAEKGRNEYKIDYDDYQSGRYFVKLTTPKATQTEIIEILW